MKKLEPTDYYYYNLYEQHNEQRNKVKGFLAMLVLMAGGAVFVLFLFMLVNFL